MDSNDCPADSDGVSRRAIIRERWAGTIMIFISTIFFGVSNTMMRLLTEYKVDNDWILFFKEATGLSLLLPWLLLRFFLGRYRLISKRLLLFVALASVFCELFGARLHVLGFSVIGLLIAVPLVQSSTLIGTAVFGKIFLGDPVSRNRKIAIGILIVSVILLSIGKELTLVSETKIKPNSQTEVVLVALESSTNISGSINQETAPENKQDLGYFLLVSAGTLTAGIAYSIYLIMLRYAILKYWKADNSVWLSFQFSQWAGYELPQTRKPDSPKQYSPFPVTLMMSIVLCVGVVVFGSFLYMKYGTDGFFCVPHPNVWCFVTISGLCNVAGFFFQVQGLRMTTAVQASLVAISQILVLSLIGYSFFDEPINLIVAFGLTLTVLGVFVSAKPENV